MDKNLELEEAVARILAAAERVEAEEVLLAESYGRILAEDVYSPLVHPPFARSPLDGYAYWAEPLSSGPVRLRAVCEIPAGTWPERVLQPGEAARIFTGAPLPQGANCVVRQEDSRVDGEEVVIERPVLPGANVVPAGDEVKAGDLLLQAGERLTPPAVGLLAAMGIAKVRVYRKPRVGLLATGSELMDVGKPLLPGKIYNSNTYTLQGLIREAGCEIVPLPLVPDELPETLQALAKLADVDVVVTTGGASVGDYDLMPQALQEYGCELLFWKVRMKPGTPACVGKKDKRLYFSLSGNPAAAMVTFELLVRPALRKYAGLARPESVRIPVRMAAGFGKGGGQRRFLRARAVWREGAVWADPGPAQGSGILKSMIGSRLLVDVPAGHGVVTEGETLQAFWIGDWEE